MANSAILILVTGVALMLSGFIQATMYGLTVYHALILLALSWLTVLAAIPSYIIIASCVLSDARCKFIDLVRRPRMRSLITLHSLHLSFTSAFGIWLFVTISTFDITDPQACTASTRYVMGMHTMKVLSPTFRNLSLALYAVMAIPFLNLFVITCIFGFGSLFLLTPPAWSMIFYDRITHKTSRLGPRACMAITAFFNGLPPMVMAVVIVVSVELTIKANHVSPGDGQWTLGQTLAVFLSLIPVWDMCKWIYNAATHKSSCSSE